jgi:hypothetical protein
MQIVFDDAETLARAKVAVTNWYRTSIETVGKAYFSKTTGGANGAGLQKVTDTFAVIINGANFITNIETEINTFTINATRLFLATQPATSDPTYAAHPLTVLKSRVTALATPRIDTAIQTDLPAVVDARLDELISPTTISGHVATVLTPAAILAGVRAVITPEVIAQAVAQDAPLAVEAQLTSEKLNQAVLSVLTPEAMTIAVAGVVQAALVDPSFLANVAASVATQISNTLTTLVAQVTANKLNQAVNVIVNNAIANTVFPTVNPGNGTVTP